MTDPSIFGFLKKLRAKTIAGPSDLTALSNTFALPPTPPTSIFEPGPLWRRPDHSRDLVDRVGRKHEMREPCFFCQLHEKRINLLAAARHAIAGRVPVVDTEQDHRHRRLSIRAVVVLTRILKNLLQRARTPLRE